MSKSISYNLNNNITCYNVVTYTAKSYNHTISKQRKSGDWLTNFWGLEGERNKYGKLLQLIQSWKFKS